MDAFSSRIVSTTIPCNRGAQYDSTTPCNRGARYHSTAPCNRGAQYEPGPGYLPVLLVRSKWWCRLRDVAVLLLLLPLNTNRGITPATAAAQRPLVIQSREHRSSDKNELIARILALRRRGTGRSTTTDSFDACASSPCHNQGTCHVTRNGYTCNCPVNYEGDRCDYYVMPDTGRQCQFEVIPGAHIASDDSFPFSATVEKCAETCAKDRECRSMEYSTVTGRCYLNLRDKSSGVSYQPPIYTLYNLVDKSDCYDIMALARAAFNRRWWRRRG